MPRPAHVPSKKTRELAEELSGLGLPHEQIAALIGVGEVTLRKYYDAELALGKAKASAQVAKTLFNRAVREGDTTAMIWWSKAQMRWAETQKHENSGPDGGPQVVRYEWGEPQ